MLLDCLVELELHSSLVAIVATVIIIIIILLLL